MPFYHTEKTRPPLVQLLTDGSLSNFPSTGTKCASVFPLVHTLKSMGTCAPSKTFHLIVIVFDLLIFNFNNVILNISHLMTHILYPHPASSCCPASPTSCFIHPVGFVKDSVYTLTLEVFRDLQIALQ